MQQKGREQSVTGQITEEAKRQWQRYLDAAHAMQTGVAFTMHQDSSQTDPKHLRVGINSAMVRLEGRLTAWR